MAGVQKIYHKGKEIVYVDYRGLTEDEMLATAKSLKELLLKDNKAHLRLVNISDCFLPRPNLQHTSERWVERFSTSL